MTAVIAKAWRGDLYRRQFDHYPERSLSPAHRTGGIFMIELGILFGLLAAAVLALIFVLLRRGSGSTENVDGLLIEQARRGQAHQDRATYSAGAVRGTLPTGRDDYRP